MHLSFCLETLYTDEPFAQRLASAHRDGVERIEVWEWRSKQALLRDALVTHGLTLTNLSANRQYGMVEPDERNHFLSEVEQSARFAKEVGSAHIMLLAQPLTVDGRASSPSAGALSHWREHLLQAADQAVHCADRIGVDLLIEPLNDRNDHPDYLLNSSRLTFEIIREIHHPRLRVLYDIYHMSVMQEDVCKDIHENLDAIGYFHLADLPDRREPGRGRINFKEIIQLLKAEGFHGVLGFEFFPTSTLHQQIVRQTMDQFQTWISC